MGLLLACALIAGVCCWAYQSGRQSGSRGGFRAGFRRGRGLGK